MQGSIRFTRSEWSGAFGDIGTSLPLIVGMILAAHLDSASALIMFGLLQIGTALAYRMPMPVQPLKAMAAIVIAQKLPAATLYGGGLAIGIVMLALSMLGLVDWIAKVVPKPVIRGVQLGLGLQLATIALKEYVVADGRAGWWLAIIGFLLMLFLLGRKQVPAAIILVMVGAAYALSFKVSGSAIIQSFGVHLPQIHFPAPTDIWTGLVLLAIPQIPLSIANSVLATKQVIADLFPEREIGVRRISLTYSVMNLLNPFFSGIPTCHGSGGMAGHYAFGGRTGGSVIIAGSILLTIGLFFSAGFQTVIQVFPLPVLGVLLLFEAIALMVLVRDLGSSAPDFTVACLVGLIAVFVPYGYVVGLVTGSVVLPLMRRGWIRYAQPAMH